MKCKDILSDGDIDQMMAFMEAASSVCEERGKTYEFTCPICGGKAYAGKAICNGHLHARCDKCGFAMME